MIALFDKVKDAFSQLLIVNINDNDDKRESNPECMCNHKQKQPTATTHADTETFWFVRLALAPSIKHCPYI